MQSPGRLTCPCPKSVVETLTIPQVWLRGALLIKPLIINRMPHHAAVYDYSPPLRAKLTVMVVSTSVGSLFSR
jgi:hypothetical protein